MKKIFSFIIAVCLLLITCASLADDTMMITLDSDQYSLAVGKSITLKTKIIPRMNLKLEWSSSDESVATVTSKGTVKGIAVGEAEITVKAADNENLSASCKVSVVLPVQKITFTEKKVDLAATLSQKLEIAIAPEDATNKSVMFTSSNEKVATVDENGVVTGIAKGTAKITAAAQDGSKVKAVINVKVDEYDLIFTTPKPQKATYYYRSGRYVIKGKVKTGCVSIPELNIAMFAMVAGGPASNTIDVTPVKPGTDTITVTAGRTKTIIKVYVSPECFKTEENEEPEVKET